MSLNIIDGTKIIKKIQYIIFIYFVWGSFPSFADKDKLSMRWPSKKFSQAKLFKGQTHYRYIKNKNSPFLVVLVHGVSGPMTTWDLTIPFLTKKGLSVLSYDLYGRGFSTRLMKDQEYSLELYVKQLSNLLKNLKVSKPLILVGSSFGSVIASSFTIQFPEKVKAVVLIGPAGFPIKVPFMAKFRDVPILGNFLFNFLGKKIIMDQNRKYFIDSKAREKHLAYFSDQLNVKGSDWAILSTMRHSPVQNFLSGYKDLGKTKVPVKVIWGKEDRTFPYENHLLLKKLVPQLNLTTIENSAHLPQYERPQRVNNTLLDFLLK